MSNPSAKLRTRKIIVVDDDDGILDAIELMLVSSGYEVEKSADGEILEKLTKDNFPDLILLDVLLSGRDGREICAKLKKNARTKHLPIIMISAEPTAEEGVRMSGADDFVSKPFEIQELLEKVKKYIRID
jgi:DNA-binding response OmpR family regulator